MLCFVSVLRVLCVFVVNNPLSVPILHHSRMEPARIATTPRSNVAHRSRNVRHQIRPFSALHASSVSVDPFQFHDTIKYDVNKCTYLYGQPPASALCRPTKNASNMGNVGDFINRPPSTVHRPFPILHHQPSSTKGGLRLHIKACYN